MSTLLGMYQQLCHEDRFPSPDVTDPRKRQQRQANLKTSLGYLAEAYESTPDRLTLTDEIETTYKARLREYLIAQGKGASTIRNSIQDIGQWLRALRQLPPKTPLPQAPSAHLGYRESQRLLFGETSPYRHQRWMNASRYRLLEDHWPDVIRVPFERYRRLRRTTLSPYTAKMHKQAMESYLGFLLRDGAARLEYLPPAAREKLHLPAYRDDLRDIVETPLATGMDDLFLLDHVKAFITWHAWRAHRPEDAAIREREPSKPTVLGMRVAEMLTSVSVALKRKRAESQALIDYRIHVTPPRKIHDKTAPYHAFTYQELEGVGLALMDRARSVVHVRTYPTCTRFPGARDAGRFQAGLLLRLGLRIPLRARNWCEMLDGIHLKKMDGAYRVKFEGHELKVATRQHQRNILDVGFPDDVTADIDEFLTRWRPLLPNAAIERHVFLSGRGNPMTPKVLCQCLAVHVYQYTQKRFFTHLLRTLVTSHLLSSGMSFNLVSHITGDSVAMLLRVYNRPDVRQLERDYHAALPRLMGNGHSHGASQ